MIVLLFASMAWAAATSMVTKRVAAVDTTGETIEIVTTTYDRIQELTVYNEGPEDLFLELDAIPSSTAATVSRLPSGHSISFTAISEEINDLGVRTSANTTAVTVWAVIYDRRN